MSDGRTYAVWPVPIRDLNFTNLYGMDVTAERAIVKFPDQNPNPVFRIDWDGALVYANPASAGWSRASACRSGGACRATCDPASWSGPRSGDPAPFEVATGGRHYALVAGGRRRASGSSTSTART